MNIEDARFLFSALIQALPTVISLSLIAVFALKPERGLFRRYFWKIIFLIICFYLSILGDIFVLYDLEKFVNENSWIPVLFLVISIIAIVSLIIFLIWYIADLNKSLDNNENPRLQKSIEILKLRYAKGELTKKQFTQMKKDLS